LDFGPIYEGRLVWNCERVGTEKLQPYIYEEHHTHRAHCWRRRPRGCVSTNTASNTPSTKTSLIATEFSAKKPQNLKQQKLYDSLSSYTRHTGMKKEGECTDTITTARQRQHIQALPVEQAVKQNGKTFYAHPDTIHNQVYAGYRVGYQVYKQAHLLASRQNPALSVHPDPHGVVVNEFDGGGPGPLDPIGGD
jgi:hypothetical protein